MQWRDVRASSAFTDYLSTFYYEYDDKVILHRLLLSHHSTSVDVYCGRVIVQSCFRYCQVLLNLPEVGGINTAGCPSLEVNGPQSAAIVNQIPNLRWRDQLAAGELRMYDWSRPENLSDCIQPCGRAVTTGSQRYLKKNIKL